nr:hypothetical protein [Desulfobacterales bacterium]
MDIKKKDPITSEDFDRFWKEILENVAPWEWRDRANLDTITIVLPPTAKEILRRFLNECEDRGANRRETMALLFTQQIYMGLRMMALTKGMEWLDKKPKEEDSKIKRSLRRGRLKRIK